MTERLVSGACRSPHAGRRGHAGKRDVVWCSVLGAKGLVRVRRLFDDDLAAAMAVGRAGGAAADGEGPEKDGDKRQGGGDPNNGEHAGSV